MERTREEFQTAKSLGNSDDSAPNETVPDERESRKEKAR
jgi:hypothetical protein